MAREWTVMVYLGADNNLSVEFLWNLKEMQEVVKEPDKDKPEDKTVAVLAQYDPGQGLPTQRYVINKESAKAAGEPGKDGFLILDGEKIKDADQTSELKELLKGFKPIRPDSKQVERLSKYLERLGSYQKESRNKNTGDPLALLHFICWGIKNYEAEHYMVVLAGHGSGAVEDFLLTDTSSQDSLTLHELKDVFQLVKKKLELDQKKKPPIIDILGLDSCLMSMAEVYYQLLGSVSYLVGAEGFAPSSGWPYQRILSSFNNLINKPKLEPKDFAKGIVHDYVVYYFDYALAGLSVDLSACDITSIALPRPLRDELTVNIKELGQKLQSTLEDRSRRSKLIEIRQKTQSYKFDQYVDLVDLCSRLKSDPELEACCEKVIGIIEGKIVLSSSYVGPDSKCSHGLSVYFPWSCVPDKFYEGYEQLVFTQETKWDQFVKRFTQEMRALGVAAPDETAVDRSNTKLPEKTLFSGKTLYSGQTEFSGETGYVAFGKAPSLVWTPPKDLRNHVTKLRKLLNKGGTPATNTGNDPKKKQDILEDNLGIVK